MAKRQLCFYNFFGLNNAGPGLKSQGIGNCKTCVASEENKNCRNYFGIIIEDDDEYEEKKK